MSKSGVLSGLSSLFAFSPLTRLEKQRQKALRTGTVPAPDCASLQRLYDTALPGPDTDLSTLKILSLDFETTGLNFEQDYVLSMGGVVLQGQEIDFGSAFHSYIQIPSPELINTQTAVINQITPENLYAGRSVQEALQLIFERACDHIILCHAAVIEHTFILKMLGDRHLHIPVIFLDTLKLERSLMKEPGQKEDLRLSALRHKRGLPDYVAHNALADSVATAELFLAQVKDIFGTRKATLGPLVKRSL